MEALHGGEGTSVGQQIGGAQMGRGHFLAGLTFFGLALGSGSAGALDIYSIVLADEASFSDSGAFFYVGALGRPTSASRQGAVGGSYYTACFDARLISASKGQ